MKLTEKYIKTLETKDYIGLSSLFDEDGSVVDHCPDGDPYRVYGQESIQMFYRNRFFFNHFEIIEVTEIHAGSVTFIAGYEGRRKLARASIIPAADGEHVRKIIVRPA